jgi:hypothetical protein
MKYLGYFSHEMVRSFIKLDEAFLATHFDLLGGADKGAGFGSERLSADNAVGEGVSRHR